MFFLCTTALSCWKLEGFPTLESPDFNLSDPAVRGQEIHGRNLITILLFVGNDHFLKLVFPETSCNFSVETCRSKQDSGVGSKW